MAVLIVGIILIINAVTGIVGKTAKLDYFEIGDDKIPTVKLALGEERTVANVSTSISGKVTTKTIEYEVSGSEQGNEMFDYYLCLRDDGFLTLTEIDFSGSRGTAIVGKNSVDDDYEIQLQIDYDFVGYTITIVKQPGGITALDSSDGSSGDSDKSSNSGGSEPESGGNSGSEPEAGAGSGKEPENTASSDSGNNAKEPENTGSPDSGKEPENTTSPDSGGPNTATLTADVLATISSGTFHMKMGYLMEGAEGLVYDIYCNYGYTAMVMDSEDMAVRMLYAEGYCFIIMDEYESIYVYDADGGYEAPDFGNISNLIFVGEGSGEFNGKTLKYDEYVDTNGTRYFYFMDGGVLRGIRTILDDITSDIEVLAFDKSVPDRVFSIPDDYEVTDMTN